MNNTPAVDKIIERLNKDIITDEDHTFILNHITSINVDAGDLDRIYYSAQNALLELDTSHGKLNVIIAIIEDLDRIIADPKFIFKAPTIYRVIKEGKENGNRNGNENGNGNGNGNLPSVVPGNSTMGPNLRFVPRIVKTTYEHDPAKRMPTLKGTPGKGTPPIPLSKKGGKRKKSRKTRRKHRKY